MKLDRRFVHGCHRDERRQALIESLVRLAERVGAGLVAEGIELESDLQRLRRLGVVLVQGFLLGQPRPMLIARRHGEAGIACWDARRRSVPIAGTTAESIGSEL